jgi:hypothetical protein
MYTCIGKTAWIEFGNVYGFRYPLRVLEGILYGWGSTLSSYSSKAAKIWLMTVYFLQTIVLSSIHSCLLKVPGAPWGENYEASLKYLK